MPDVAAIQDTNANRQQRLAMEGVIISPMVLLAAQVEVLVTKLAPLEWAEEFQEILTLAEQEVTRAKLTAGLGQGMSLADIT